MVRVALDFGRAAHMAFDQDPGADAAQGGGAGEVLRLAGDQLFGGLDVGDDLFGRLDGAAAQTAKGQGGAHDLEEVSPRVFVGEFRGLLGKLARDHFLEAVGLGQFVEAAPVLGAVALGEALAEFGQVQALAGAVLFSHRWQIEQLVSCEVCTSYSLTS